MPGSSLWLIPPATHPLHAILTTLITDTLPSLLLPPPSPSSSSSSLLPTFSPHLTLTSSIPPATYSPDPQAWLDSIPFPSSADVRVSLESVRTEDVFLRRCYLRAEFAGVRDIAAAARAAGVESEGAVGAERTAAWLEKWRTGFGPHVSLAYGNDPIDEAKLEAVAKAVREAGVGFKDEAPVPGEQSGWDGWEGGVVWLVPTDRPISQWRPIATREL